MFPRLTARNGFTVYASRHNLVQKIRHRRLLSRGSSLRYGFDTTSAERWMVRVRANIGFPMPATLTFVPIGFRDRCSKNLAVTSTLERQLRYIQQLAQKSFVLCRDLKKPPRAAQSNFGLQRLANGFCLTGLFQFRQRDLGADRKQSL